MIAKDWQACVYFKSFEIRNLIKLFSKIPRYLQEYTSLGTAGGLHHFRDQIRSGNPDAFFVLNGDVCADFPLKEMKEFHHKR